MTDNVTLNRGRYGDTIAADEIAGVKHQRVKVQHGADGSATDVSSASPLPVGVYGTTGGGDVLAVPVTQEGHLEVAIHGPLLPFGSVHVERLRPLFQIDGVYGVNAAELLATTSLSGTATTASSLLVCTTGTTQYGSGVLQSRRRLRYRAGQGSVARLTAMFPTAAASSILVAGLGHAEDGIYVGYNGTAFGILYSRHGRREIQTLTVTTRSTTAENVTVTLNDVAFTVAVTNAATTTLTAWEIAKGTYAGWKAEAVGATVVFVRDAVGTVAGAFSVAGTSIVGTFAETSAGVAATETWIAQADWNGDALDGNGASGFTLDPARLNIYQFSVQYLGAGSIGVDVMVTSDDSNNPIFVRAHTIKLTGTLTATNFGNPSFPVTLAAYSAGSTTDVSVKSGSMAGFIEGDKYLTGPRLSYFAQSTAVGAAAYRALFSVRNTRVLNGRANQSVINLLSLGAGIKHGQPVTIVIVRDATLAGTPSFAQYATGSAGFVDTAATTFTFASDKLVWSGQLGETGNLQFAFSDDITLQPGEMVTVGAITSTQNAAYVLASLNTREDQ